MEKLKQVFSPGSKKDDEVLYGDAEERRASAVGNTSSQQQQPEQLHAVEDSNKKERGVLGQILNPGGDKYDEQRFGTTATTQEPVRDSDKLYTDPKAPKEHSILRQVLNPNNEKYDEERFGETAATGGDRRSSVPATQAPPVAGADVQLQTDPGVKDHSILRQVFNPHGDKYDSQGYGSTAHAVGDKDAQTLRSDPVSNPDSSISRQILWAHHSNHHADSADRHRRNPGNEKYDPVVHGSSQPTAGAAATSTAAPSQGTTASPPQAQGHATPGSALSVKSGVEGPFARQADSAGAGVASTQQTLPDRTTTTTTTTTTSAHQSVSDRSAAPAQPTSNTSADDTHHGRDAAVAGGAATAVGGAGYYAASRDNADQKITDRPHPMSDRAGDATASGVTAQGSYTGAASTASGPHAVGPAGGAHINPVGAPEESLTSGGSSLFDRDVLVGAGAAGVTGADAPTQINSAPSDVQNATYTERAVPVGGGYHHTSGPHQTDIANIIDPHVPGEFPTEEGTDRHGLNNPPLGAVVAEDDPTTAATSTPASHPAQSENKTLVGTIASAVGLGGLVGGGVASNDRSERASEPALSTSEPAPSTSATAHPGGESYPIQTTTNTVPSGSVVAQGTSGIAPGETSEKNNEHHYGRDAGIAAGAAGAGAAGYGAYEATRDRDITAPTTATSGTAGQTSRQAAPTTSTTSTTSTTAASGQPSTTQAVEPEQKDHDYGRDAAVAGGAGVAGYGAYEATKDRQETGPASKTIGPHESNVANIVDPRVQPDPQKQKTSTTVGPHGSDLANKADPRVESDPAKAQETHHGRDAAVAGGAGLAGAGAVAATRYDDTTAGQAPITRTATGEPPSVVAQKAREEEIQRAAARAQQPQQEATTTTKQDTSSTPKKLQKSSAADKEDKEEEEDSGEKEKKHGLLHKILHPGSSRKEKEKEKEEEKEVRRSTDQQQHQSTPPPPPPGGSSLNHPLITAEDIDNRISTDEKGHNKLHKKSVEQPQRQQQQQQQEPGTVTEPHTGLPMNVGKYGTGEGGTDGSQQIAGYRDTAGEGDGVAGPDWDAVKKANTPY